MVFQRFSKGTRKLLCLHFVLGLFCSCTEGSQGDGDSRVGDGHAADSGDAGPDEDEEVIRTEVSGTDGFCKTIGSVSVSCIDDADCVGIRKPVGVYCFEEHFSVTDVGCEFVAREDLPETDECGADDFCRNVPRVCSNNTCSTSAPESGCDTDQDCRLEDYGCACMAMNVQVDDYQPVFGEDCTGRTACPQEAGAACIDGSCRQVGSFMNSAIGDFCEQVANCGFSDEPIEDCRTRLTENNYEDAASIWPLIQATSVATDCIGLLNGPWNELMDCIRQ